MTQSDRLIRALRELNINSIEDLNKAIRELPPLNIGIMTKEIPENEGRGRKSA